MLKNTHAERLAALWKKTAQAGNDDAGLQSVLAEGAEALRAGQLFYVQVGHVEGNEFVIDSHVLRTGPNGGVVSKTGDRIPLAFDDLSVRRLRPGRPRTFSVLVRTMSSRPASRAMIKHTWTYWPRSSRRTSRDCREINDTLGHDTGDASLVAIAATLRAFAREGEDIASVVGDKFAILMTDHATSEEAAARVRE